MTYSMATMMTAAMVMEEELRIEADSRHDDHAERYAATGRDLSAFDDMVAEAEAETAAMRNVYRDAGRRWIAAELEMGYKRTPADFRRAVRDFAEQALGWTPNAPRSRGASLRRVGSPPPSRSPRFRKSARRRSRSVASTARMVFSCSIEKRSLFSCARDVRIV